MSPTIDICGYDYVFLSTERLKVTGKVLQGFRLKIRRERIKYKALSNKKLGE
ncbi:hypothetical protein VCRA2119O147_190051 [Vibrio crassostreae]|uniref:Uncharacterized protein n=1 Tax=Vibrio crassostreae TaxID=246167 RepID=A0A822MT06_9VIBR|nr:hypothetical protein VCRA2116O28_100050 [Vibrio crassostreae]CAK1696429.1 hypothetical protein VCRA2116O27_100050 [Vibrio crassostreae]CAK1714640.1 hypothetical protein VCRA2116O26_110049 [Vibrio crassostreae]CAK1714689.1 hypothetical protein VCRA2117O38_110049 [Vibrio crassostreae]CAK1720419.1 hypothetical protein VCRA2119O46_110108 [Vibrio crassostreae]